MRVKKRTLVPVDENAIRLRLTGAGHLEEAIDPLAYYTPLIRSFEKIAVSKVFWFILDFVPWRVHEAGGDIEKLTPFKKEDFVGSDNTILNNATHPQDLEQVHAFTNAWVDYIDDKPDEFLQHVKMSLYFRMLNSKGEYYWIMVTYAESIRDAELRLLYGLVLVTDISHIKQEGKPMMNILDMNSNICQQFHCTEEGTLFTNNLDIPCFTKRERQVLLMLTKGYGSKQIADQFCVSVKTIDNHRQNMLHKTGSKSSSELVSLGIRMGVV